MLEGLASASYVLLEFPRSISEFEQAYAAYRRAGDGAGAVRTARTLGYMYGSTASDWAVAGGWIARAKSLLSSSPDDAEHGWIVGARCAGAPAAMLLARKGYRVLVVDRASFPSDTLSTHVVHAPGVAALQRWGLLSELVATGCPPIERYSFDFGAFTIRGTTRPVDAVTTAYAPRRTVLDAILVSAAAESGAEVRFNVDGYVIEDGVVTGIRGHSDGGSSVVERARIVIGADGRNSHLAKAGSAAGYNTKPRLEWGYYTYFSGLPTDELENHIRPDRG